MSLKEKKVEELKEMCKQKKISGYSKLKKEDLIKILSKKKGGQFGKYGEIYTGLSKNYQNQLAIRDDYFIALESDNKGFFNEKNNKYYENNENNVNNVNNVKRRVLKIVKCRLPGLDNVIVNVKVTKIEHMVKSKGLMVVQGTIVNDNI